MDEWTAVGWLLAEKKSAQHTRRRPALQVNIGMDGTRVSYTMGVMTDDDMFQGYRHISHGFTKIYSALLTSATERVEGIINGKPANLEAALKAAFRLQQAST